MHYISQKVKTFLNDKSAAYRLLLYFAIVLVFFSAFAKLDFATDTYAYVMNDSNEIMDNFLRCGRILTAGLYFIFLNLHVSLHLVNFASFLLGILTLTFALYYLEKLLRQNFIKSHLWSFLLPLLIILNPFIIEFYLFIEKGIMCLSILLCVLAAVHYNDYFQTHDRRDLIWAFLLTIISTIWYQGTLGLFIILATLITIIRARNLKQFIQYTVLSVIIYIVGPIIDLVLIKIISSGGRTGSGLNPLAAAEITFSSIGKMFKVFDIIPWQFFWGYLAVILVLWLIHLMRKRTFNALHFAQVAYLVVVVFLATIAPQLALDPASVWIAPRATYPFATLTGSIMVLIMYFHPKFLVEKPYKAIAVILSSLLLIVQLYSFNSIILDHYSVTEIDHWRSTEIVRTIWEYEQKNQIEIKAIAPSKDQTYTYSYPGIFTPGDSNISAFNTEWSDVANINYWNNRHFERLTPPQDWVEYCASHDWHGTDQAQYKFDGDIFLICWY